MNKVQVKMRPDTAPLYPYPLARLFWAWVVLIIAVLYLTQWAPVHAGRTGRSLPFALACVAVLILGYGLSAVLALLCINIRRLKTVLWPIPGKFISAAALTFVTPFAVLSGVPWIFGGLALFFAFEEPGLLLEIAKYLGIGTLVWYPIASLIICGTRSKLLRFGLFCLMFWSCYSAHLLYSGWQVFHL